MKKAKFIILALVFIFLTTAGLGCKDSVSQEEAQKIQPITLNYWRVWDSSDTFDEIIKAYKAIHPNITIKYRKLRYEEYERELVDSFAEGRGPDIFSVHAGWVKRYQNKITPLPAEITMAYPVVKGTIKKEETVELRTSKSITAAQVRDEFVPAVYDSAVVNGQIYGLPLSVDTMVLFYNRDLLNNAGITDIPRYWDKTSFLPAVKKLTRHNEQGDIVQAGVPLGTSENIERYSDILTLLMMQNGAQMLDERGRVSFHRPPSGSTTDYAPGVEALRFYTDFANPIANTYTWNTDMPNSLQAFVDGSAGFFLGYAYHISQIKTRAPRLNFGVSKMLQIEGNTEINSANFWVEAVSAQSGYSPEAWDFIQFATRAENVQSYLNKAQQPTARKSLINQQLNDTNLAVFASQLLTARTWYHGSDYNAAEVIIGDMIEQVLIDPKQALKIMQTAAQRIQQTIQ